MEMPCVLPPRHTFYPMISAPRSPSRSVTATLLAPLLLAATTASAEVRVRPDLTPDADLHTAAVSVPLGETLTIEMPSPPAPGHAWEPRLPDPAILEPVEDACPEPPMTGRSCFAFTARASGETVVSIVYRRHWETRPDGLRRYDLAVTVGPGLRAPPSR